MIAFRNGGRLCQFVNELPKIPEGAILYGDFETTSRNKKLDSINPWFNCWPIGFACTYTSCDDTHPYAYFIPAELLRREWLQGVMQRCSQWVNHNIKYDMHVAKNCLDVDPCAVCVCTVARAKLLDSLQKFKGGYSLDVLSKKWLGKDISHHEEIFRPYLHQNKDYGEIPIDYMAEYACDDVLTNRELDQHIDNVLPEESLPVADTEYAVTTILYQIERNGIRVNPVELRQTELSTYARMVQLDAELTALVGRNFNPGSSADCFDVLCNQYGMPVMKWTNEGDGTKKSNPSFDKDALKQYRAYPGTPADVVERIIEYRALDSFNSKYTKPFQTFAIDGAIHCTYNQVVETGRSSCTEPSMHQNNKFSKGLIHPADGYCFISLDLSQIEFRMIVHYIQNARCIQQYCENPDTDFHTWVADMCGIDRQPAKSANFCMGYGGGEKTLVKQLSRDSTLVGNLVHQVEHLAETERGKAFQALAEARASSVYSDYHSALPELKPTSRDVARVVRQRGYCRNMYGRRRYLPRKWAHIGFNSLCQSSSADMFKEMLVSMAAYCAPTDIELEAQVHDEILLHAPLEVASNVQVISDLVRIMETPRLPLRVPVRASVGMSAANWREASSSAKPWPYKQEYMTEEKFASSELCVAMAQKLCM